MAKGLREIAEDCARAHRKAFSDPAQLGKIVRVWSEGKLIVCIEYSSGSKYHYTLGPSGNIVWY